MVRHSRTNDVVVAEAEAEAELYFCKAESVLAITCRRTERCAVILLYFCNCLWLLFFNNVLYLVTSTVISSNRFFEKKRCQEMSKGRQSFDELIVQIKNVLLVLYCTVPVINK
jgi:hypothetical protein